MGPGHGHHVGLAVGENAFGLIGVDDPAGDEYRKIARGLDAAGKPGEEAVWCRGGRPVQGPPEILRAVVSNHIEVVQLAGVFKLSGDGLHVRDVQAAIDHVRSWNPYPQNQVWADHAAAGLDQLHQKPGSVLE